MDVKQLGLFLLKNNIHLMTLCFLGWAFWATCNWAQMPLVQKLTFGMYGWLILHEYEENYQDRFIRLVSGFMGLDPGKLTPGVSHISQSLFITLAFSLGLLFPQLLFLTLGLLFLGILEGFVHNVMIFLFRLPGVSPGWWTAILMCPYSIWAISLINGNVPYDRIQWLYAALLFISCFFAMEVFFQKMIGNTPANMKAAVSRFFKERFGANTASWNPHDIPSQAGRQVVITGATSGIGYYTALELCKAGANVTIAVRNMTKGRSVVDEIVATHPMGTIQCMPLDLSSLSSVREFATMWKQNQLQIDTLILNAGISNLPTRELTADGFERQFETNYLGHFLLTQLLLGSMRNSSDSRIVVVSSSSHKRTQLYLDDLQLEHRYMPMMAYGHSKLALLTFAFELARRLKSEGSPIRVIPVHPGMAATDIGRSGGRVRALKAKIYKTMFWLFGQSAADGAWSTIYASVSPEAQSGHYYGPCGVGERKGLPTEVSPAPYAKDERTARELWNLSEKLLQ